MGKGKKDEKTASGTDTTSSPPAAAPRQDTICLATSGSTAQTAQAPGGQSSSATETGKTRQGTKLSADDGNDVPTTPTAITTPPAAGPTTAATLPPEASTIPPGDVQDESCPPDGGNAVAPSERDTTGVLDHAGATIGADATRIKPTTEGPAPAPDSARIVWAR